MPIYNIGMPIGKSYKEHRKMDENKVKRCTKTLTAYAEQGVFTRQDGKKVEYTAIFVDVMGIKVKLVANDNTGKQLLESYFKAQ